MKDRIHHRTAAGAILLAAGLGLVGCGGSSSSSPASSTTPGGTTPTTSPMRVAFGDAPADWIMAFGMTVDSVTLTTSGGSAVQVAPAAADLEMMQLMGSVQPVSTVSVPQGSYTQAAVAFSNVTMGYMDPISHTYKQKALAGPYTATVPFTQGLTVGSTAMNLNFDMDMASSVAIDGSGNVTLTPTMTASTATVPASGQTLWSGGMQHQVGTVSGVSASGFTMGSMMGIPASTFTTNASTRFAGTGLSGLSGMASGMMVAVDAALQADGSYLATRVQAMDATSSGTMGGGIVTALSGNPPTQMTVAVGSGMGSGMMASSIGGTATVALSASNSFAYDDDGLDLAGLPFTPAFGLGTLALGQRVEAVSPAGMMGGGASGGGMMGTLSGGPVTLEPQGLHGAVSAYAASGSQATFTLTLPTDSAFATLTGVTSVQVYQQAGTLLQGLASVSSGAYVNVRGLLFFDGTTYRLVAAMIEPGASFTQSGSTTTPPAGTTSMQIGLGDAPSDWITALGMTVNSVMLTSSSGSTVNVAPTASLLEMTQLMAGVQPVSAVSVPQGTYTQATVTMSSVSMGYMDPSTKAYTQKTLAGPFTATVPFSPSLTVGAAPMALSFDMDLAASVAIDGSGNVTLAPVMTASAASVGSTTADPWAGAMQHQVGSVSNATGSTFTMGSMMGIGTATFAVDASTQFAGAGLAGLSAMASGMLVDVDAVLQANGTYLARRVEGMGPGASGMMGGGIVTAITGNPPSQFTLALNAGMGGGMMASTLAATATVTVSSTTPWAVDSDLVDLTGLPFAPAFGPTTFSAGQRVEVTSNGGMTGGTGMMGGGSGTRSITAAQVRLEPQGLHGTVSAYAASGSQATFTLTLPSDSAFATLTGATSIQVYQQAGTLLHGLATVGNGQSLEVRGLLFFDGTTYRLVAGWMTAG